jgi:hypothetical protein
MAFRDLLNWRRRAVSPPTRKVAARYCRPALEDLEGRVTPSASPVGALAGPHAVAPQPAAAALPIVHQPATTSLPITVNSITSTAGQLVANASLGGQNFQIPLTLGVPAGQDPSSTTQILNLHLGEIHLNVLGLKIDTSEICLNITAQSGSGNLLGNLLAGIAHSLDAGQTQTQSLGNLSTTDLNTVTTGLTNLLNGSLSHLTAPQSPSSVTSSGTTNIMHLPVGPVNLNLLGLQVNLDNCHAGPITVDVSAQSGAGNLLGNLLGSVSHLLDVNPNIAAIDHLLSQIGQDLSRL